MSKEQNSDKSEKALRIGGVIWRKFLPFIPILGIPLTIIYHREFGDTGIENSTTSFVTAFVQAVSLIGLVFYAI